MTETLVHGFSYYKLGLTNAQIEELMHRENAVIWNCSATCVHCGDHMFWFPELNKWLCRSWLYMDGGCNLG